MHACGDNDVAGAADYHVYCGGWLILVPSTLGGDMRLVTMQAMMVMTTQMLTRTLVDLPLRGLRAFLWLILLLRRYDLALYVRSVARYTTSNLATSVAAGFESAKGSISCLRDAACLALHS